MITRLEVELYGSRVGELVTEDGTTAVFRFDPAYWKRPDRPVLGQWFEDGRADEVYAGRPGGLPPFFANLEPEGALAHWLAKKNHVGAGVLDLLAVAGEDLVGAVRLVARQPPAVPPRRVVYVQPRSAPAFALPGVQMKLPMSLDRDDRLVLTLPGELSSWFLKVPLKGRYRYLSENEAATMNWARQTGFEVPECRLREPILVDGMEEDEGGQTTLLVARYDRTDAGPLHQEDLAQAQWLYPEMKYPMRRGEREDPDEEMSCRRARLTTMEGIARYALNLLGPAGVEEFLRRSVFVIASGNGDAHVKNWSLLYREPTRPAWAPVYDQVSTIAWHEESLALPLYGKLNFARIERIDLVRLGAENGMAAADATRVVDETLLAMSNAWCRATEQVAYPPDHRLRLLAHWNRHVPLTRHFGPLPKN